MSVFPEGLEPVSNLMPAAWVREALPHRFGTAPFLGGSGSMIDQLVGDQILESFEVGPDTPAAL